MFKKTTSIALLSLLTFGCSQQSAITPAKLAPREAQDWLTDTHAQLRKQQVSDVAYQLDFDLSKDDKFSAVNTIEFNNHLLSDDLTIDFSQGQVDEVWVNGQSVKFGYNNFFITVPKSALTLGKTSIKIKYTHKYSDNGSGLYRYTDASDNKTYLYTHFEPYEANKLFPGFDQPNLRANYTVNVTAPADWSVVTSVRESKVVDKGNLKQWHFPKSAKISSYIFPLHAGPYHVWEDKFEDIPLRMFARESLAQYVDSKLWFDVTKKGLAFYNDYFDYRYPFGKYDQLIVPDFNISGMENVAAVTYSERTVSRGVVTQEQKERTAGLLLHEMSHMWFGDLITIDWWSNLWLKESFATYMANLAMSETGLSDNAWSRFYTGVKQRAYNADKKVTTHPIQMPVSDTKNGVASFDAITYSKGASVLNQLTHHLGATTFRDGIRQYFKKYDYQATKLPDFMGTLGKVAKQDLTRWTDDWLYKAGTNRVSAEFTCSNGKITTFSVNQSYPAEHPYLRQHTLNLGLYALNSHAQDNQFELITSKAVKVEGKSTPINDLTGTKCPDMVYPNKDDWGFVKVILDDKTRNNVVRAIPLINDPMLRAMFYQSLWDLVDDEQLSITDYVDLVTATIANEKNLKVLNLVLNQISGSRFYLNLFDAKQYSRKQQYLQKIEDFIWQGLAKQMPGSDHQRTWFGAALSETQSLQGLKKFENLLNGSDSIDGLSIDQDLRWAMLAQLAGFGHANVPALLAREKANDSSYKGELAVIAIKAIEPSAAAKLYWLKEFEKTSGRLTAQKQKTAMYNLFPSYQSSLKTAFADRLLKDLVAFDVDRDQKLIGAMVRSIMPFQCTAQSAARLKKVIDNNPQLGLIALKGLKEVHQNDTKCLAISKVQ